MEEKKMPGERRVGIGTILPPDSYKIEGEVLLLRVRLNDSAIECLIDAERRVKEIVAAPQAAIVSPRRRRARWRSMPAGPAAKPAKRKMRPSACNMPRRSI